MPPVRPSTTDPQTRTTATAPARRRLGFAEWIVVLPLFLLVPAILTPLLAMAGARASLSVTRNVTAGEELTISGTGFGDDETVLFRWDGKRVGWLRSVETNDDGAFTTTVAVPDRIRVGDYTLVAEEIRRDQQRERRVVRRASAEVPVARGTGFDASLLNPGPRDMPTPTPSPSPSPSPTPDPTAAPTTAPTAGPTTAPTAGPTTAPPPPSVPPAVGVAGYGAGTKGGAGGRVVTVTNLNDSGSGSLRAALEASGPRTVVFAVGGTINLGSDVRVTDPFLTVDGSSAPKPVIVRGGMMLVASHDVILRHLRFRPGDQVGAPADVDAVSLNGLQGETYNIVLDHLTMIWGPDIGGLSILGNVHDTTVQYSIMGEGLYLSRHPEAQASQDGHSMAANIVQMTANGPWPTRITFHHNLFTTSHSRMPRVQGAECVDLVNNVVYNWGQWAVSGNPRALNIVNNWFRAGPETMVLKAYAWQKQADLPNPFSGSVYHAGNAADGFTYAVDAPSGVLRSTAACGGLSVSAESAQAAYNTVVGAAGATLPVRDAVDQRIISNVLNRSGTFFNGAGHPAPTPYDP